MKKAFTLAEVLITLGIIGVVAALTMPTLMQKRTNAEVEAKLKKIYSVMNQAILMSENDNGPKEYWDICKTNCKPYYDKYFLPYISQIKTVEFENGNSYYNIAIYFNDGTLLIGKNDGNSGRNDFFFYPNAKNFESSDFGQTNSDTNVWQRKGLGRTFFAFSFAPYLTTQKMHYKKGFEPLKYNIEELTDSNLKSETWQCTKNGNNPCYCTALIQLHGWKIPDDYPFTVK